ncbi:zeta toxin family protein [Streptomyces sp. bgisy126]|uniref:zeta toxin family protein n=1 Tax=unclassified Streptomyces TaxID=2593676 RepID=UPI003EC13C19
MPQERPVVVVVASQPEAGKTAFADLVQATLERRGRAGPPRPLQNRPPPLHRSAALSSVRGQRRPVGVPERQAGHPDAEWFGEGARRRRPGFPLRVRRTRPTRR